MTRTQYRLDMVGETLPWSSLFSFVNHLPPDSAYRMEIDGEMGAWGTTFKTNMLIADLIDSVHAGFCAIGGSKSTFRYPRPWDKKHETFGSDPIPISQFDSWWNSFEEA